MNTVALETFLSAYVYVWVTGMLGCTAVWFVTTGFVAFLQRLQNEP